MQWPQALDLKWLLAEGYLWSCCMVKIYGIDSCLLLPAVILTAKTFLQVPISVISVFLKDSARTHSQTLPSRVGSICYSYPLGIEHPPLKHVNAAEPRNPQAVAHPAWEK